MIRFVSKYALMASWIWVLPISAGASGEETLDPCRLPRDWTVLLETLRDRRPLRAEFLETRKLPFRRQPILLSGTLRLDEDGGLSLHYPEAEGAPVTVIDREGMAMRSGADPWHPLPDRNSIRVVHEAIASLLSLDLRRLGRDFELSGSLEGETWSLQMTVKPGVETGRLKALSIHGTGDRVTDLRVGLGDQLGIQIEILDQELLPIFEPAEYDRYFR